MKLLCSIFGSYYHIFSGTLTWLLESDGCVSQISEASLACGWNLHAAWSSNRRYAREKSQREGRFQQTMSDFGVDVNVVCVWQRDWQHGYDWPRRRCVWILFSIISHRRRPRRVETVSHMMRGWCWPAHPGEIGRETTWTDETWKKF